MNAHQFLSLSGTDEEGAALLAEAYEAACADVAIRVPPFELEAKRSAIIRALIELYLAGQRSSESLARYAASQALYRDAGVVSGVHATEAGIPEKAD